MALPLLPASPPPPAPPRPPRPRHASLPPRRVWLTLDPALREAALAQLSRMVLALVRPAHALVIAPPAAVVEAPHDFVAEDSP